MWTGLNRLKDEEIWTFTDGSPNDAQSFQDKPLSNQNADKQCGLLDTMDPPAIKAADCDKRNEPMCMVECLQGKNDPFRNSEVLLLQSKFRHSLIELLG